MTECDEGANRFTMQSIKGKQNLSMALNYCNFLKEWHLYMLSDDFLSFLNAAVNKYKLT